MKLAIVTRAYNINDITKLTHPIIKRYANSVNADFLIIDQPNLKMSSFHNEIFQIYDFFDTYDRICIIDSDIIINNLPNIFDIVDYHSVGVCFEDNLARKNNRIFFIKKISKIYNIQGFKTGYINSGFMVVSKIHKELFNYNDPIYDELGYDDVELSYRIFKYRFNVHKLSYKFNHMSSHSEIGLNWLKSYVIHYAGRGFYRNISKSKQIEKDLFSLKNKNIFLLNFVNILPRIRLMILGIKVFLEDRFLKTNE